ncbi:PREDICTED: zinc-finger homeodomain protein 5 [Nelumbo nucifera]|uniref:Zinc-finger homeodomain protein 5 n=1 Tax=Nelumbo nucifera TaxID=4432 RepID=A0A1U8AA78_NELNU|nr:PREDICTED: zinc-finger homeodomain protein 5 [Nelumbo nucifera]XP_019054046.1 PREDICTED: zinc-finger homeodomain protein 5 [Nelumbo nucifera]XP_019054047.1 PREDICTED: zinc-finger homeodomain protein 5 [Nelumbo nucifera]XP_019054048.1 PREDICTED: zinc-finger homeodomain protein 5 [Nelumbo nucifera]
MELRGQDKERGMPSSLVYNPPIRESSSKVSSSHSVISTGLVGVGERRKDGTGNGTAILNPSQTLDHLQHQHLHLHHHQPQGQGRTPDPPEPDPVPVAVAVGGATGAPVAGGSNSRTPPSAPTTTVSTIPRTATGVRYRECLKNHAASIGGHVVDGCGEFMPSGEEGTPEALKCAACDCHRNFHRKDMEGEPQSGANCYYYYNKNHGGCGGRSRIPPPPPQLPPQPLQQHQKFQLGLPTSPSTGPIPPPMMMAFCSGGVGGGATESSSEDLNVYQSNAAGGATRPLPPFSLSKKRFRTKFTQEQKDRMLEFAEKVGWRIQKQDEPEVQQFCAEVGVKRQVLKVWMHNNKHSAKKKQL